jgi:hypothetical protein
MPRTYMNKSRSMKHSLHLTSIVCLLFTTHLVVAQATFQTKASGAWSTAATWTITSGSGGSTPGANDNVVITNTYTVTQTANATCKNITINSGGRLITNTSRNFTITGTTFSNAGTHSGAGNVIFSTSANGAIAISGSGSFATTGNWTFNKGGTIASAVSSSSLVTLTLASVAPTFTVTNNGSISVTTLAFSTSSNQWNNASNSTLSVKNNFSGASGVLRADATGNTVIYTSTSTTIKDPLSSTYYHLNLASNSGTTKQLSVNTIILGNLTIGSGVIMNMNSRNLSVKGNISYTGTTVFSNTANSTLTLNGTSGTQTVSGTITDFSWGSITINHTGSGVSLQSPTSITRTITLTAGTATTTSTFRMNGTSSQVITGGTGTLTTAGTFTVNNASGVTSSQTINLKGNFTLQSGTFTNNGALNFNGTSAQTINGTSGTLTTAGTFTVNNSSGVSCSRTLNVKGGLTLQSGALSCSAAINFNGTSAQTINGSSGSLTTNAAFTLNNSLGLSSSRTINVKSSLTLQSGTFTSNGALNFTGTVAQTITGTTGILTTPGTLTINNSAGVTSSRTMNIQGGLALTAGTLTGNAAINFNGTSAQTINGTSGVLTANSTVTVNNSSGVTSSRTINIKTGLTLTSGIFTNNSTLNFNGTVAQTISGTSGTVTCGSGATISISNAAGVTTSRSFTIDGTLAATSGTFNTGTTAMYVTSVAGNTGRIGNCTGGSISGSKWFMNRYIAAGDSGWQDISSPINGANISSWDSTLYLSMSPSCPDGLLGDGTYQSVYYYDPVTTNSFVTVTNCTEPLTQARGFEIWLATTTTTFVPTTIRTIGVPTVGTINTTVGNTVGEYALVGNPYMSPIQWSSVIATNTNVQDYYYVFDETLHTYAIWDNSNNAGTGKLATGGSAIPAYQGFWVENANTTSSFTFNESHKTTSSAELRSPGTPNDNLIRLRVYSKNKPNAHESIITFREGATAYYDEKGDASFLPSRDKYSPAITPITPDHRRLTIGSYPTHESILHIPIHVTTGVSGNYFIDLKNIGNLRAYSCLMLEDVSGKKMIHLSTDYTYAFNANDNGENKFILHCYKSSPACMASSVPMADNQESLSRQPLVLVNENGVNLYCNFELPTAATIEVYNMVGQIILRTNKELYSEMIPLTIRQSNSVYSIKIITQSGTTYTKKVFY